MLPASFEYERPASVEEAIELLKKYGEEAKILAGGHSLIPSMKLRLTRPSKLIDIGRISELKYIRDEDNTVAIGATVTHWMIESSNIIRSKIPLLSQTAGSIGDVQVRNMGTIGGSLAHADPAADYPAAILATEAEIVVQGPGGKRTIKAGDFFVDLFQTALEPNELIIEIRVPAHPPDTGVSYLKFPHPASGFAVVGCAAMVTVKDNTCQDVRVAFTGLANKAFRDEGVESALKGKEPNEANVQSAAEKAGEGAGEFLSDTFASGDYRHHLAKVYAKRALMQAIAQIR
jgi:carbon-monoxide dehydrogenase medium subunit